MRVLDVVKALAFARSVAALATAGRRSLNDSSPSLPSNQQLNNDWLPHRGPSNVKLTRIVTPLTGHLSPDERTRSDEMASPSDTVSPLNDYL
jgi:hypothetical protein